MSPRAFLPVLALALGLARAFAGEATEAAVEAARRADELRLKAMMAGDGAALARIFSDDLIFVHSDGRVERKAEYIGNLLSGGTAYADARTAGVEALQVTPDSVVLTGIQEMRKQLGPNWENVKLRYLSVWRREAGAWRMVAWLSARPAGNSVVPKP